MTVTQMITTFIGAAIFPFIIRLLWGHFEEEFGAFGGFMSALFIVGVVWALNHGFTNLYGTGLIFQTGGWVDMGGAAGIGLIVASVMQGAKFDKHTTTNVIAAIVGGLLGGLILALTLV